MQDELDSTLPMSSADEMCRFTFTNPWKVNKANVAEVEKKGLQLGSRNHIALQDDQNKNKQIANPPKCAKRELEDEQERFC
jgi:hypothetical protein